MIRVKSPGLFTSAGFFSAVAASLCCITPVIALLAGSSSIAANFLWIEPARPYLIGLSIAVLAFAWYLKLKPAKRNDMDCDCRPTNKDSFRQSKTFLAIVTFFAILMMTFPLYAKVFYPKPKAQATGYKVEDQIQQPGEKYAGKGKMPHAELCIASEESSEKDKKCSQGSSKSCCDKNE